jgi:hypothetical protein
VYVVQRAVAKFIKVGYSCYDDQRRIFVVQRLCPDDLIILGVRYDLDQDDERRLHKLLKDFRIRAEWYRPDPKLFEILDPYLSGAPIEKETVPELEPGKWAKYWKTRENITGGIRGSIYGDY